MLSTTMIPRFRFPNVLHAVLVGSSRRRAQNTTTFTPKQGQYLAFIDSYTKIHRVAPAEADFQQYFRVTPPTVHRMIMQREERGFMTRVPRQPRSIQLLLSREELPDLA